MGGRREEEEGRRVGWIAGLGCRSSKMLAIDFHNEGHSLCSFKDFFRFCQSCFKWKPWTTMVGTPSKLAIDEKNVRNLITNVCDRRSLDVTLDVCDRRSLDVYVIAH